MPAARQQTPQARLNELVQDALGVARTAKRLRRPLDGANFYASKMAQFRVDATVAFREFAASSAGDVSAIAELIEICFAPKAALKDRLNASRELALQLATAAAPNVPAPPPDPREEDALFPLALLSQTGRGYLLAVGRQMNGCFVKGWYDACAVMMRRLIETSLVEAFEACGLSAKVKDGRGEFLQLTGLIDAALSEPTWNLTRQTKAALPRLRDVGHTSAHSRYFTAQKGDIERVQPDCRVALQELLSRAKLL